MNVMPPLPLTLEQAIARQEGWYAQEVTRCQRNNNPGNIEWGKFARAHGATGNDGVYAIFPSAIEGFNALAELLLVYVGQSLTLRQAIYKWAPPTENDTEVYLQNVCHWTNFTSGTLLKEVV